MTHDDEIRAIALSDAAGRAAAAGIHELAQKLIDQAVCLFEGSMSIPSGFSRHVYASGVLKDERGGVLRDIDEGTVIYIKRSR